MENNIIIVGYSNVSKEGVVIHLNKKSKLYNKNKGRKPKINWRDSLFRERLITNVCFCYNTGMGNLKKKSRKDEIIIPRQIISHLLKTSSNYSTSQVAEMFGQTHASIINSSKSIESYMLTFSEFDKFIKELKKCCKKGRPFNAKRIEIRKTDSRYVKKPIIIKPETISVKKPIEKPDFEFKKQFSKIKNEKIRTNFIYNAF
jgi:hypothetical protein